jgi:hypothetical protein
MGVAGRAGKRQPTPLDYSTNSGWNSLPSLLESLDHVMRLFEGSLAVSRQCEMSLEQKLPELCISRGPLSQQHSTQVCQDRYQLTASMLSML